MFYKWTEGHEPLLAVAVHNGHELRQEVDQIIALEDESRLREEDPYTGMLTTVAQNQLVVYRSRFEVDLNRPREKAIYISSEDAWDLKVWKEPISDEIITRSLKEYDRFYARLHKICSRLEKTFGRFAVLDLHSYNHRRQGPEVPPEDQEQNPDVNIGTGTLNRDQWTNLVDRFTLDLRAFNYLGRSLDVRENVKFKGGHLVRYIHDSFPNSGCALAVEFKKFFMDEWTGKVDDRQLRTLREALLSTLPGIVEELSRTGSKD
ncbi:MAG: N-formylglutamate amidohydrolase [Candidatus Aminicenantes bacterium]|nr:N-formylglutamate amidohydrolase [Candidatus Aminicenantes bacterium]